MTSHSTIDPRDVPRYSPSEASRYLWVNAVTITNWAKQQGVFPGFRQHQGRLTFNNLMEAHVLASLRLKHRISMPKIRRAINWVKKQYDTPHPLLHPNLATDGLELFIEETGLITSASENGQEVIREVIEAYLDRIHRDKAGNPICFYPFTRGPDKIDSPKSIMINPLVADGRPVVHGTRLSPGVIFERFKAVDKPDVLAKDYELDIETVYEAIRAREFEPKAA